MSYLHNNLTEIEGPVEPIKYTGYYPCTSSHDPLIHAYRFVYDHNYRDPLYYSACHRAVSGKRQHKDTPVTCLECLISAVALEAR